MVEKGAPGLKASVIGGKTAKRAVWQADITLDGVRVPAANRLAGATGFGATAKVLTATRAGVAWEAAGHAMASLAKMNNAAKARQMVADARDLLGGNGILLENHVARHQADMEAVYTYEGTDAMQSLIIGREITGHSAFSAA